MTTLGSWIDAETVSGLGKELTTPAAAGTSWAGAGMLPLTKLSADDFRLPGNYLPAPFPGPDNEERDRVREMLRNVRRKAEESGLVNKPGAPAEEDTVPEVPPPVLTGSPPLNRSVPYFTPPVGPLATRIRAFIDWLRRQIQCHELFIVDQQGSPASDRESSPELVTAAILMAEAGRRAMKYLPSTADGAVHLDLPEERKLCVIDTVTTVGPFFLGLVLTDALSARAADRLRRALRRTIETEPANVVVQQRAERW
jgi:hypothetical protein